MGKPGPGRVESLLKLESEFKIKAISCRPRSSTSAVYEPAPFQNSRNLGIYTETRSLINPDPKSKWQKFTNELKESIYASSKYFPLGKSRKALAKPENVDNQSQIYGKESQKCESVANLIISKEPKTPLEVQKRNKSELDLTGRTFGRKSYADLHGKLVAEVLNSKEPPLRICTSTNCYHQELEIDPIEIYRSIQTPFHATDIAGITYKERTLILRSLAYLNKLRDKLGKRFHFQDLINYFEENILKDNNYITKPKIFELLKYFDIDINLDRLDPILRFFKCVDKDGNLSWKETLKLLDNREKLEKFGNLTGESTIHQTTYQSFVEVPFKASNKSTEEIRVPLWSKTSLRDETHAAALINPSMATLRGLSHRDYLTPRSVGAIYQIFHNAGFPMERFDEIYFSAAKEEGHPRREVSVDAYLRHHRALNA